MEYNDEHRNLLQFVAGRGVTSLSETKNYMKKSIIAIKNMVKMINGKLEQLQQKIKIVKDENTSNEHLVFISFGYDAISIPQKSTKLAKEVALFKELIQLIMKKEYRKISRAEVLMNFQAKKKTDIKIENLLDTWCRMFYLKQIGEEYSLGLRLIHEFEGYFDKYMPGTITKCWKCKSKVYEENVCQKCKKVFHWSCLTNNSVNEIKWPCCDDTFREMNPISEVMSLSDESSDESGPSVKRPRRDTFREITPQNEAMLISDESSDESGPSVKRPRRDTSSDVTQTSECISSSDESDDES